MPDHVSIDLFRDAVKRGVRVRVMVAGVSNDTLITRLNSVRLYGALLDAGVELYEYNRTMMHHKIMMIDGLWSTVGTANFDNRSFSHNEESNVSVLNEGVARELTESFERDIAVSRTRDEGCLATARPAAQDARGARVVRAGSGLGHRRLRRISPKKLQNHSLHLAVEGALLLPRVRLEPRR